MAKAVLDWENEQKKAKELSGYDSNSNILTKKSDANTKTDSTNNRLRSESFDFNSESAKDVKNIEDEVNSSQPLSIHEKNENFRKKLSPSDLALLDDFDLQMALALSLSSTEIDQGGHL